MVWPLLGQWWLSGRRTWHCRSDSGHHSKSGLSGSRVACAIYSIYIGMYFARDSPARVPPRAVASAELIAHHDAMSCPAFVLQLRAVLCFVLTNWYVTNVSSSLQERRARKRVEMLVSTSNQLDVLGA